MEKKPPPSQKADIKKERLAKALRENLKKRKEQARLRKKKED
jgi:hypothetical protein